jgi:uncharacterized delta-60 repeat protein
VLLAVVGIFCLAASVAGAASGGIDRGFGDNGLVRIDPVLAGYERGFVPEIATGPKGGIFLLDESSNCSPCVTDLYLTRLTPNGAPDAGYGGSEHRAPLPSPVRESASLAVDSRERQLVATHSSTEIVVTRLLPDGTVDRSFGTAGEVSVPCACDGMHLHTAVEHGDRVEIVGLREQFSGSHASQQVLLVRLSAQGELDSGFGDGGQSLTTIPEEGEPEVVRTLPDGATIVAGYSCCPKINVFLWRFSPHGRLDRHFMARSRRAISTLATPKADAPEFVSAIVPSGGGRFDVLGNSIGPGYVLRVLADGRIDHSFGRHGIRFTKWSIRAGAADRAGHVLAIGHANGGAIAFWLGRDGAFQRPAVRLKHLNDLTTAVVMQNGRPLLFDADPPECRGSCPPAPELVRLQRWVH